MGFVPEISQLWYRGSVAAMPGTSGFSESSHSPPAACSPSLALLPGALRALTLLGSPVQMRVLLAGASEPDIQTILFLRNYRN